MIYLIVSLKIMRMLKKLIYSPTFVFFFFFSLLIAVLFCGGIHEVSAQDLIEISADRQLNYANHCFEKMDYTTAAAEYKKFIYFFPDDERIDMADYKIGLSYFNDKAYIKALNQFTHILDQNGPTPIGILSAFMISRSYQRVRNYPSAIENLIYLKQITDDTDMDDKIFYHLGWLYLESGDFVRARSAFSDISIANQTAYNTGNLSIDLTAYAKNPTKNPITAGILSIIPGGGYLYCGRYQDALTAFLVNSVLIYGAYESFDESLYAIGGLIAAVEMGFYAGNIYGGVSSAHKFNQKKQNEFVHGLKKKFHPDVNPKISINVKPDSIVLGMTVHF
jgi:hypothetical protein